MLTLSRDEIRQIAPEIEKIPSSLPQVRQLMERLIASLSVSSDPVVSIAIREPDISWMTTADVATLYGVSERTVRQWCEKQYLQAQRMPGPRGSWRIRSDQFPADLFAIKRLMTTVQDINQRFSAPPPDDYER
ncbi:helix-turn-helix domain-containing protein [Sulfobacillus thermosulfidooxidans]|uniref:helix-turn-helix domain-containing protein n=1 Tax=Sulfobacillus thermosulfidooxidans TaxID=28034 RepID=UPI0006B41D3F|nr:helix-turn-helix domain-containing protein [Sulfobacillus thermosulfidooxidans]